MQRAVKAVCDSISFVVDASTLAVEEREYQVCIISSMAAKVFLFVILIAIITVEGSWKIQMQNANYKVKNTKYKYKSQMWPQFSLSSLFTSTIQHQHHVPHGWLCFVFVFVFVFIREVLIG